MSPHPGHMLQYGSLAGWPHLVARGLRAAGYNSLNVVAETGDVEDLDRRLPYDRALNLQGHSKVRKFLTRSTFGLNTARSASLVHYHGAVIQRGQWHHMLEGRLFSECGIPMVMSFGGGDARIVSQARALNPYFYRQADEARDNLTRAYLRSISRYIGHVATDYEMIGYVSDYFEHCHVFRQPVDLDRIPFNKPKLDREPVVLHVPTEPWVKGTETITAVVDALRREGHRFEFRLKRQMTQSELFREIADCDIYVDELRCGAHGVTAVETMAAGKPTITYIRPDLVDRYPSDMPLVNANPDTFYEQLRALLIDGDLRAQISYQSRAYAEKYHDLHIVVQDLLKIYRSAGWRDSEQIIGAES